MCCHCTINKQWMHFYMLSMFFNSTMDVIFDILSVVLLIKQLMQFSLCYHCLLNKQWMNFYKCSHCCFTKQWMWISTCCHYSISNNNGCLFSMCSHSTFNKQWMDFLTYVATAVHQAVEMVSYMLSLLHFK